jgi:hypothetical protein
MTYEFSHEITTDATGTIDYARVGSHGEDSTILEVWRFTTPNGRVSIVSACNGVQSHYFSSDAKTEERGRFWNGAKMAADVRPR